MLWSGFLFALGCMLAGVLMATIWITLFYVINYVYTRHSVIEKVKDEPPNQDN